MNHSLAAGRTVRTGILAGHIPQSEASCREIYRQLPVGSFCFLRQELQSSWHSANRKTKCRAFQECKQISFWPSLPTNEQVHLKTNRLSKGAQRILCTAQGVFKCRREAEVIEDQASHESLVAADESFALSGRSRSEDVAVVIAASLCLWLAPTPTLMEGHPSISPGAAHAVSIAGPLEKLRKVEQATEQVVTSIKSGKVVDKVMQVVTAQTMVTVDVVDKQLKAVLDKDPTNDAALVQDFPGQIASTVQEGWSWVFDAFSKFDPFAEGIESFFEAFVGLLEGLVERFAAFELTAAVSLGQRWLIFTPPLAVLMWWQMTRGDREKKSRAYPGSGGTRADVEREARAVLVGQRVRRELKRLELKGALSEALEILGPAAMAPRQGQGGNARREVEDILTRLQELNPKDDPLVQEDIDMGPENATANDSLVEIRSSPQLDGDWQLVYVSDFPEEPSSSQRQRQLSQIPGVELRDIKQVVRSEPTIAGLTNLIPRADMVAQNSAEIRLGPLGTFHVAVEGKWRNQTGSQAAVVSFDSFTVKPKEFLGNKVNDDFPPLSLAIPLGLQEAGEWETVFLDDSLRINRGSSGSLYLFRRLTPS